MSSTLLTGFQLGDVTDFVNVTEYDRCVNECCVITRMRTKKDYVIDLNVNVY